MFRPKNSGHCVKRLRRFRAHTTAAAAANDLQVSFGEEAKNFTPNHEGHGRDQTFSQASLMPSYVHISVYYYTLGWPTQYENSQNSYLMPLNDRSSYNLNIFYIFSAL